ncbi:hypothetical protein [Nocardioides lijunqiniae]|uniref:hypothetical protein n=1 Tax=Nocardioides lijunqiniae TaxID=2760832 RepID=UPI001878435D|nr:hypothetical protein [Nocardioides lijunqiniae]
MRRIAATLALAAGLPLAGLAAPQAAQADPGYVRQFICFTGTETEEMTTKLERFVGCESGDIYIYHSSYTGWQDGVTGKYARVYSGGCAWNQYYRYDQRDLAKVINACD